jgi:putative membrane protein
MSSLFAFLHHVAAFAFVACLALELVLIRDELTLANARRLPFIDLGAGVAAGVVLVVGLLRVGHFEKGAAYYLHSAPFIAKMALFATIAALSIAPTLELLSWRKDTRAGRVPVLGDAKRRLLRRLIHLELVGVVLVILCAALMARGVGYFG